MDGGVGHTASAPDGREGQSQAGPKGRQLEVGPRRLLVFSYFKGMTASRLPSTQAMKAMPGGPTGKITILGMCDNYDVVAGTRSNTSTGPALQE